MRAPLKTIIKDICFTYPFLHFNWSCLNIWKFDWQTWMAYTWLIPFPILAWIQEPSEWNHLSKNLFFCMSSSCNEIRSFKLFKIFYSSTWYNLFRGSTFYFLSLLLATDISVSKHIRLWKIISSLWGNKPKGVDISIKIRGFTFLHLTKLHVALSKLFSLSEF